ncbi:HAD-superfamily hydrolase, subfamily IA, variant 3 [Actinobacteria bacterium OK074]|nr:HAD-superfamily hydrolase, subfamily IA, variant 3 [Actinobacteria bacterium OK074]
MPPVRVHRHVLFDLFGVIARTQSPEGRARIERVFGPPGGTEFWDAYWALRQPYDRGDQLGPDYWQSVAAKVGTAPLPDDRVAALVTADVASWDDVDDEMVGYLGALKSRGTRLGLLSNIPAELATHYERRHGWLKTFDVVAFSSRIGHAKPEPEAYDWCAAALGAPPDDILFVDDRAENVTAARAAGMRSHLFTGAPGLRAVLDET